jgi:hypothetical protein
LSLVEGHGPSPLASRVPLFWFRGCSVMHTLCAYP